MSTGKNGWTRLLQTLAAYLVGILLFAALPLIGALGAGGVAHALGCTLDEGDVHPCPFLGVDLGEPLYAFGVMGWLILLTVPAGAFLLAVWLFMAIVLIVERRRAAR